MERNKKPTFTPQSIEDDDGGTLSAQRTKKSRVGMRVFFGAIGLLLGITGVTIVFYVQALQPVNSQDQNMRVIEIVSGATPSDIGRTLKEEGVIRSELAFSIYTRVHSVQNSLQAGIYQFRPSDSTNVIVATLVDGAEEQEFEVTFLPGATLEESKKVLLDVGFEGAAIDRAFRTEYDHPLFAGRPKSADIEGYLYGETHRFTAGTSLNEVLTRFFDDFYTVVQRENLVEYYKKQGLTLYEGITLASIIQRESGGNDEAQIAQVFFLRLKKGVQLGSDVTYQYIADKLGVARDVNLDNPYNTRRYAGLPPGPIAAPGERALRAVAHPARGDYLYFLSGDDGVTYFAHTNEEHEANIKKHCQQKCEII